MTPKLMPKPKPTSKSKFDGLFARVATAFIAVTFLGALYYFLQLRGLYIFSTLAALMIGYEAGKMSFKNTQTLFPLLFLNACWFIYFYFNPVIDHLFGAIIVSLTIWVWMSRFRNLSTERLFSERKNVPSFILFSLFCPTFVLAHMTLEKGLEKFIFLLFTVFLFDTLSFFFGKFLGKKIFNIPLYPTASPTKTIEGALLAGIASTALLVFLDPYCSSFSPFAQFSLSVKIPLILFYYLLALTGDLVESLLKRSAGTKDSGSLLPGHGGFFDRLDGVLFASILSFLLLQ